MTLKEANYRIEKLNNELDKLLKDKELLEIITLPKSVDTNKIMVDGGKHNNLLELYVEKQDLPKWKNLDKRIQFKQKQIKNLMNWVDRELKILSKYDKVERLIVYYKEECLKEYTWLQISNMPGIYLSDRQCQRIYKKYRRKRVENGKNKHLQNNK